MGRLIVFRGPRSPNRGKQRAIICFKIGPRNGSIRPREQTRLSENKSFAMNTFFDVMRFMPHGHCFQWDPGILWTSVISDTLIAIS